MRFPFGGLAGMRRLGLAIALSIAAVAPASAHQLIVFAFVDGDSVAVEVKFTTGRVAQAGIVKVYDGSDALVFETTVNSDGTARFPLEHDETGLKIEVDTGEGHSNYWILTPQDIAAQRVSPVVGLQP